MSNKQMDFVRVEKRSDYTVINNEILKRTDLSWKAKGIMAFILSLPDDWDFVSSWIIAQSTDGRDSFLTGWKELKQKGYVITNLIRDDRGIIRGYETVIRESCYPETEKPDTENPFTENPNTDNPQQINTNIQNTNKQNTNACDLETKNNSMYDANKVERYGTKQNVLLSNKQYKELKEKYPNQYQKYIERLSLHLASTGKHYRDHQSTIILWIQKDKPKSNKKVIAKEDYTSNTPITEDRDQEEKEIMEILSAW